MCCFHEIKTKLEIETVPHPQIRHINDQERYYIFLTYCIESQVKGTVYTGN